jgi:soluble lytic murein transglycosylase
MRIRRTLAVIVVVFAAGVLDVEAQSLPSGLSQSGGVVMMQPIPDYDTNPAETGPSISHEQRPGQIRFLSPTDHDLYTRAFESADRGNWLDARALAAQGHDSIARRLIDWRYLLDKNSGASFSEIDAFLKANPDWPARDTLYARAEAALDLNMTSPQVIAWFGSRAPVSAIGKIRLGEALVASGRTTAGRDLIRDAWTNGSFDAGQELEIVQRDGSYLTAETDRQRLSNLLWREDNASARRELARVPADTQRVGQIRLTLRSSPSAGQQMAASLPADLAADPDLLFDRARSARRAGDNATAETLLLRALMGGAGRNFPAKLWSETNITIREALKDGNYRVAYQLAANTGLTAGDEFSEAEFLAGWIALRFLKEPRTAVTHFQKLEAGVTRPISLARAHYWEGRAREAAGNTADAWQQYHLAARAPVTFYGQLALAKIDATPVLHIPETALDGAAARGGVEPDDMTHAMRVLGDLGLVGFLRVFALRYEDLHPEARHVGQLAQFLVDMGYREVAVRVAKQASYGGTLFLEYTHPVIAVPAYRGLGSGPEPAVVLGLIRQETEFDPTSVSGAGARGIMQIMPASARHTASVAGIPYRPNDLLADPVYNMQLGMAEFGGDLNDWSGSLVLAAAAYNAGPTNARRWLASNGDPRSPATDPLDWIEQIPFSETRNYVMRVLENTQIYRNRLAGRDQRLRIMDDLYRPNTPNVKVLAYEPPPAASPPGSSAATALPVPSPRPPDTN